MLIKEQNTKTKSLTALNLNKVIALSINLSIHTVKSDFHYVNFVNYCIPFLFTICTVSQLFWNKTLTLNYKWDITVSAQRDGVLKYR